MEHEIGDAKRKQQGRNWLGKSKALPAIKTYDRSRQDHFTPRTSQKRRSCQQTNQII